MSLGPNLTARQLEEAARRNSDLCSRRIDPRIPEPVVAPAPLAATLDDAWREYASVYLPTKALSYSDEQIRYYNRDIKPSLGGKTLEDLQGRGVLVRWLDQFSETPTKQDHIQAILSKLFSFAATRFEEIDHHPLKGMKTKNGSKKRNRRLEPGDEIKRFGDAWSASMEPHKFSIIMLLLTGCRVGALINLHREHIKATTFEFPERFDGLKGTETVYLSNLAQQLVPKLNIGQLDHGSIRRCLNNILKDAGISNFRPHDFRHTHNSLGGDLGIDQATIEVLQSHSLGGMADRYSHRSVESLLKAQERITKLILRSTGIQF